MAKKKVVALGGDGIGPEVVNAACRILENCPFDLEILKPPCGEAALATHGTAFPAETRALCGSADAVLFGATDRASVEILAYLRWVLDNYVNIRPMKYYPGARSGLKNPEGVDFVILRENSEGIYSFAEGDLSLLRERLPEFRTMLGKSFADFGEGKFAVRIISEKGAERFARFACAYALKRRERKFPGKLTLVTKSNVLWATDGVMERVVQAEVKKYPELAYERFYVDDAARRLIRFPDSFDVIATSNLFGDVLGDEAAELVGGIGLAGSACVGGKVPYFEAIHGSAPDIAGKGIANPTATIVAARLMLEYFGMDEAAAVLEKAIESVYAEGKHLTPDQGGNSSTDEMADAILRKIR